MFKDVAKEMNLHGISAAQSFSIRARPGASSGETGVDVHYITDFTRGNIIHEVNLCLLLYCFVI